MFLFTEPAVAFGANSHYAEAPSVRHGDKKHAMYVLGMEVDFQDGLNARGFVFNNPQAKSTCGCGSSFSGGVSFLLLHENTLAGLTS